MTDWTQRIDDALVVIVHPRNLLDNQRLAIANLMNEYAIERLEELRGAQGFIADTPHQSPDEGYYAVAVEDIEAMQRSLKERLAKGGEHD